MTIQWYPGHMKAARKEIAQAVPSADVVIELLDARMPLASSNPLLSQIRGAKPCLKLLAKSDLAEAAITRAWVQRLETETPQCRVLELSLTGGRPAEVRSRVSEACKALAPHRDTRAKPVRALVVGIPNVGKSTLINVLKERKVANSRDQPGLTKTSQIAQLQDGTLVVDTAGVLWPRIDEASVLRLALAGSIPDSELDYETLGSFAASFLLERYPDLVRARFGITDLPETAHDLLEWIGRRHGALRAGGKIDLTKAGSVLAHDFRSGKLGRISLEFPEE